MPLCVFGVEIRPNPDDDGVGVTFPEPKALLPNPNEVDA